MKTMSLAGMSLTLGATLLLTGGCFSSRSGTTFSRDEALRGQRTYQGTVENVTAGKLEGTQTPIGAIAGGVLGGVAGSAVGGGKGKDIATVGGVLAGAAAGALAEEAITSKQALSITVKLDDGRLLTIVQEADTPFQPGQRVRVLETEEGRMRVQAL
ncbi:MAG: glycine zipper 2TM domain-containing protein [Kiritimatiellae bacterium]|nr:glycine zipper 2TM domain-containing protein [Kiritimatiellia bacterium]